MDERANQMKQIIFAAVSMVLAGPAVAQDSAPRIDDIVWQYIDSYCSFMRADHEFDYDDPDSWRWVLFSNLPGEDGADPIESPFMRIDGQLLQLEQTGVEHIDGGALRSYRSHNADPYLVDVSLLEGAEGYENLTYSGTIRVSRDGASSEIAYKGDCGV
ncbi:MAG: hypothetical protein ABJN75_17400 [Hoeflea sp.]|uniref:hypothetical protein n=1 Tax=Hoeflea sp. TaxID=1940281 RepID=UPI00329A141F